MYRCAHARDGDEGSESRLFSTLQSFGLGAQAQPPPPGGECEPPDCIPLPSGLTLARELSAYSIDTLTNGELTITYRIFDSRDEEIGEPLLVTTLAPRRESCERRSGAGACCAVKVAVNGNTEIMGPTHSNSSAAITSLWARAGTWQRTHILTFGNETLK